MKRIEPPQSQQNKPSHSETIQQSLLVVRGDDKAAQHKKEIDEKPGVAQKWRSMQMAVDQVAVGFEME